jgi:23S rRNA pseudouridine1911/1915/1917 synthase
MIAKTHHFDVEEHHVGERLDRFLSNALPEMTRSRLRGCILEGRVQVDTTPEKKPGLRLRADQQVTLDIPEPEPTHLIPEDLPLDIVYEDDDFMVVNKAPGMVVHPAPGNPSGTLVNAILHHCPDLLGVGGVQRPGLVHRLDKDTSGLLVVARNDRALNHLSEQLRERTMTRVYAAIILGTIPTDTGIWSTSYGRHPKHRFRFSSKVDGKRHAITRWRIHAEGAICSLALARLETGRTHQIRVHFADHNHPVAADPIYGRSLKGYNTSQNPREARALALLERQALHAAYLSFNHPVTGERLHFGAPLPTDMSDAVRAALGDEAATSMEDPVAFVMNTGLDRIFPER